MLLIDTGNAVMTDDARLRERDGADAVRTTQAERGRIYVCSRVSPPKKIELANRAGTIDGHSSRGPGAGERPSRAASCGQGWIVCPIRFSHSLDPQLTQLGMGLDRLAKRMNLESLATGPNQP
jgi:hypothetical protein